MGRKGRRYQVCAAYDTETCNMGDGPDSVAYVVCYQVNDLRDVDLRCYEPGRDDHVRIMRHEADMLAWIEDLIEWGRRNQVIPVVCAYNLMFDLKSLMYDLRARHPMAVNAQTSTSVYTLDLLDAPVGHAVLRFWDTFYLDMRGLAALGEVAGLPKATGDWDYSLVRTPDTPLTDSEGFYATRDVQVVPAYLRYLLEANAWMTPGMLGSRVLTKTSLVRQQARAEFTRLRVPGSRSTVADCMYKLCATELAPDYHAYALRKACFRGGLTFTAARYASVVMHDVMSLDVTSMHHTFMSSRVPVEWRRVSCETLQCVAEGILRTPRAYVLAHYERPFQMGLHAKVRFTNLRLRNGSCFECWGIATLARGKFQLRTDDYDRWQRDDAAVAQEEAVRAGGWHDAAYRGEFAYGKLYAAGECDVFVSEVELWLMSRVYEWDAMRVLDGECTASWCTAPDYVSLQSNEFFEMKSAMKRVLATYREGERFAGEVSPLIPEALRKEIEAGTARRGFLESYYTSTVKGTFNSIYGTQAQDVYKPGFLVREDGSIHVDVSEVTRADNFEDRQPGKPKVLYTYGLRIVGRSRLHLVLAMELLYESLGGRIRVCGGDTDSIKAAVDADVTDDDVLVALAPLHDAADVTLAQGYARIRRNFPKLCSDMRDVGHFDVERCGSGTRYPWHMELWNKCRMSIDTHMEPHVTCAGLSRPDGTYNILDHMSGLIADGGPEHALTHALGYNVYVEHDVSHALERTDPGNQDMYDGDVTDWRGETHHVHAHMVHALYGTGRMLGEMTKATSIENVAYLKTHYGRDVETTFRRIGRDDL